MKNINKFSLICYFTFLKSSCLLGYSCQQNFQPPSPTGNLSQQVQYWYQIFDCGNGYHLLAGQGCSFDSNDNGGLLSICKGTYNCGYGLATNSTIKLINNKGVLNSSGSICQANVQQTLKNNYGPNQAGQYPCSVYYGCSVWFEGMMAPRSAGDTKTGNQGNSTCTAGQCAGMNGPASVNTYIWNNWKFNFSN